MIFLDLFYGTEVFLFPNVSINQLQIELEGTELRTTGLGVCP